MSAAHKEYMQPQPAVNRRSVLRLGVGAFSALAFGSLAGCTPDEVVGEGATSTPYPTTPADPTSPPQPDPTITPIPTATPLPEPNSGVIFTEHGDTTLAQVGITIDDFLEDDVLYWWMGDYLRENPDVKLTMFPVGNRVLYIDKFLPGIWSEWLEAGHVIGWHSMHHADFGHLSADELRRDIAEFNQVFQDVLGQPNFQVRYARATFGNYGVDGAQFAEVAEELGLTWVLWSSIPSHNNTILPLEHPDAIVNGDISLFHVRWQDQYWLERYVEQCRLRGLEMVTVNDLHLVPSL